MQIELLDVVPVMRARLAGAIFGQRRTGRDAAVHAEAGGVRGTSPKVCGVPCPICVLLWGCGSASPERLEGASLEHPVKACPSFWHEIERDRDVGREATSAWVKGVLG